MSEVEQSVVRAHTDGGDGDTRGEVLAPPSTGKIGVEQGNSRASPDSTWRENISLAADMLGIIGFVVTIVTLVTVKKLRLDVLSRTRLPSHIQSLKVYATDLNSMLNDLTANTPGIVSIVAQLDSTLAEIVILTSAEPKSKAKALRARVKSFAKRMSSSREGWDVHADINGLVVALQNVVANERVVSGP